MKLTAAGNTLVPAILALEKAGFVVSVNEEGLFMATRGEDAFIADSPECVLGLIKLVDLRGRAWNATDAEIEDTIRRFDLADDGA